jgi:hypothetical protein
MRTRIVDKFDCDLFRRYSLRTLFAPGFLLHIPFTSSKSRFAVPFLPLLVLLDHLFVVLIAVHHAALLQMAPVLDISSRAPISRAKDVSGLAYRRGAARSCP